MAKVKKTWQPKPSEYPRYTRQDLADLWAIREALEDIAQVLGVKKIPVFEKLRRLLARRDF